MSPLLLVLDLDETLLHSTEAPLSRPADLRVLGYHTYLRPGVFEFLDTAKEHFRLAVWTASGRQYATPIVRTLLGDPGQLAFFYCAEQCTRRYDSDRMAPYTVKKLARVKRLGFSLRRTLHIDNTPETYSQNYGNGVPVRDFVGDPADQELGLLMPFLLSFVGVEDVRPVEKRQWWARSG